MEINPNEIYQNQKMQKLSEWNHKRQWEMGENNMRGRTPRTSEKMSKKVRQNTREDAWERKRQRERERTMKQQGAQEWKWGRETKCKSKNSEAGSTTSVMGF